jgi:hypothetical protein
MAANRIGEFYGSHELPIAEVIFGTLWAAEGCRHQDLSLALVWRFVAVYHLDTHPSFTNFAILELVGAGTMVALDYAGHPSACPSVQRLIM